MQIRPDPLLTSVGLLCLAIGGISWLNARKIRAYADKEGWKRLTIFVPARSTLWIRFSAALVGIVGIAILLIGLFFTPPQ